MKHCLHATAALSDVIVDCSHPEANQQFGTRAHIENCAICPFRDPDPLSAIEMNFVPSVAGPVAPSDPPAPPEPRSMLPMPGDVLAFAIKQVIGVVPCGKCAAMQRKMNYAGWLRCWSNRKTICEWLVAAAAERQIKVDEATVMAVLVVGFRELWKDRPEELA